MGQNESKNYQKYQQQQQKLMANAQMHFMQHQSASMCQNVNPNNNSIHFVKQGSDANEKKSPRDSPTNKLENMSRFGNTDSKKLPHPTKNSMFKELLECPICMNTYDNPYVLPCQHTFCKKCIASLKMNDTDKSKTISCPICRESHHLTNGVESLTANYTMKRLIELEEMALDAERLAKEKKAKCFVCQKYAVLSICDECSYVLCKDCLVNEDHHLLIDAKLNSKKSNQIKRNFTDKVKRNDYQSFYKNKEKYAAELGARHDEKMKLLLVCYSSEIENNAAIVKKPMIKEIDEDEYRKCSAYLKASAYSSDRVFELKKMVEKKFGLSVNNQVMVYQDNIIKDDAKHVFSYHMAHMDKIHVFDERDFDESIQELESAIYGNHTENASSLEPVDVKPKRRQSRGSSRAYRRDPAPIYEPFKVDSQPSYKQPNQMYAAHNNFYNYNQNSMNTNYTANNNMNSRAMMYQPQTKQYAFHSNFSYY